MRKTFIAVALASLFVGASAALAAPPAEQGRKESPPAVTTKPMAIAPPVVTERDVVGQWCMGTIDDNEWYLTVRPDHTLVTYYSGIGAFPEISATWKLTGNRFEVDKPLPRFFPSFTVVRYKSSVVLLPDSNWGMPFKRGYDPSLCFWHYTMDRRKGVVLPHDAADWMKGWVYPIATAR